MYSNEIQALLEKLEIKPGDTIGISGGGDSAEGVLMPRSDAGDNSVIVIKRKDGYNIGLRYSKEMKITKQTSGAGHFEFPKLDTKPDGSLSNVALLYTGGTIGSKVDYMTGGVYMLTKPEELLHEVPELKEIVNIDVHNLMSIASEDMTYLEWQKIAEAVAKAFGKGARGVIITHGTDTMHYTSSALSFMLRDLKGPVVITGAQRSSDRGSSDAFLNLICSAHLAANSNIAEVGICMHKTSSDQSCIMIRGTKARKMHTSRRDAFRPINGSPIASVDRRGEIEYKSEYKKMVPHGNKTTAMTGFEERVALVKAHPNSNPDILDYYVERGYRGIIIEGTGMGHVPSATSKKEYSWISHIKSATEKGVVVGMTSQCIYGRVNSMVYRNLRLAAAAGAIYCEDMLPEVAYVKLGFLLGNYKSEAAKEMLNVNIAGEITTRTEFEAEFAE